MFIGVSNGLGALGANINKRFSFNWLFITVSAQETC